MSDDSDSRRRATSKVTANVERVATLRGLIPPDGTVRSDTVVLDDGDGEIRLTARDGAVELERE